MAGTVKTPGQIKEALVLREAGYSLAAISVKTNISPSTLARHFAKHGAAKGALSSEAVEEARQQLITDSGFINGLKQQIAASISDDLSHVQQLREAATLILEQLMADKSLPAHYKSRGVAALATSLSMTQKAARTALKADDQPIEQGSLPELFIYELTPEEVELMRSEQQQKDVIYDEPDIKIIDESVIGD